jgi:ATP-dependent Clp protease protease subunit
MSEPAIPPDPVTAGLFARRIVTLRGVLDDQAAGRVAAELMMLDASGDGSIELFVDSGEGTLEAAFAVMDTIDLLGVPVRATCLGRADGPAVGVVAVAHRRRASAHGRFHLIAPRTTVQGTAGDLQRWVRHHQSQLEVFAARLADATGRPVEHVEADLDAGRYLNAEEAIRYGLIDELWSPTRAGPPGAPTSGRPPLGYGPTGR